MQWRKDHLTHAGLVHSFSYAELDPAYDATGAV